MSSQSVLVQMAGDDEDLPGSVTRIAVEVVGNKPLCDFESVLVAQLESSCYDVEVWAIVSLGTGQYSAEFCMFAIEGDGLRL